MTWQPQGNVSPSAARELIQSGEWVAEDEFRSELKARLAIYDDIVGALGWTTPAQRRTSDRVERDIIDALVDSVEQRTVRSASMFGGSLGYPIGRGRIVKVGATFRRAGWQTLGVIAAVVALLHGEYLMKLLGAKRLIDETAKLVATLRDAYERLEDPKELAVFDAMWMLRSRFGVSDYDALARGDLDKAYGVAGATVEEIASVVSSLSDVGGFPAAWRDITPTELQRAVEAVLQAIRTRGVLNETRGRWRFSV